VSRVAHLITALIPEQPLTVDQACERLTTSFPPWVITGWLFEFGYNPTGAPTLPALKQAVEERGPRITHELLNYRDRVQASRSCRS
jgi:hypothetical protein